MSWETVIGLEIHAQLSSQSKAFCACANRYGDPPNRNVCPVCLGLPGALPVPNRAMVAPALRLALALGATVHDESIWARKNYFYPDLPKGYQISQYDRPLATGGALPVHTEIGIAQIGIARLHLEEDAGKSLHDETGDATRIDFNRCGVPLAEIVTEPELRSPEQASAFLKTLHRLVVQLGVCDGNLEQGNLRCDANLSVRRPGEPLRTRSEVKNLNSFRFLRQALAYERDRHIAAYERGETVRPETRLYDPARGVTLPMRSKEAAHDYRYFPEPDLPPLRIDETDLAQARAALPELPWQRVARYMRDFALTENDAERLADSLAVAAFFETAARFCDPHQAAHWITGELAALWKERGVDAGTSPVSPQALAEMINLLDAGKIGGPVARRLLVAVADGEGEPSEVVARHGWGQIDDDTELHRLGAEVLEFHPQQVAEYRAGKTKLLGFFVGQTMARTQGRANPEKLRSLLEELLAGEEKD